jgi:hypothetical protein
VRRVGGIGRGPLGRPRVRTLGPVGAVLAFVVALPLVLLATLLGLFALAAALVFARGGKGGVRMWRFGGPGPAAPPPSPADTSDAHEPAPDAAPPAAEPRRGKSYAEIVEAWPLVLAAALLGGTLAPGAAFARLLVPMDDAQTNHLKAYGLAFWVLEQGQKAEWLLNYRGGSFLLADDPATEREANIRGVVLEPVGGAGEAEIRAGIADENMETVALEKAPKVAVYIPPNTPPWDDAVTLALQYADIPYARVWDEEVLKGDLAKYDWLHLHHEDFTGQHGKFWAAYHSMPWYIEEEAVQKAMAAKLGFAKVSQLKGAVAVAIRDYVARGGFMFGMCSATDTYDIALASAGVDIADVVYDGDPPDPGAQQRLDFSQTLAFRDFRLEPDPIAYRFSDIDVTADANQRGPNTFFTLFAFSAKNDPVPTMLTQNHVNAVAEFLGQSTGFRRTKLKPGVVALGEVEGTDEVKYLHGQFGRGTFTFLGGHDPEDYQHMVGDPETKLDQFPHSPGYRLILNNVLFPAAEKKKQKT